MKRFIRALRKKINCCRMQVIPSVELAERAGPMIDNGVLADSGLRTSDPHIYAVGDIANIDHPTIGRRVRVKHRATRAAAFATLNVTSRKQLRG
jgi:NADPH-dependent 2,4-dienoyl-CoA reductase/sulfur reductase-like enzyme